MLTVPRGAVPLEFGHDQPTAAIQGEHVQPVIGRLAAAGKPSVELERHDAQILPENPGVGQDPLLEMFALP
jgi:hypothetical protein